MLNKYLLKLLSQEKFVEPYMPQQFQHLSNLQIESDRLLLVPISTAYLESIFKEFTEEVTTYTHVVPSPDISQTDNFIRQSIAEFENGSNLELVILLKETNEFIGCTGLHDINTSTPELGIWIKTSAYGHYYGREAIAALKSWAEKNLDYEYLRYPVDKRNIPSRKIPESLGGVAAEEYSKTNLGGKVLHIIEYRLYK